MNIIILLTIIYFLHKRKKAKRAGGFSPYQKDRNFRKKTNDFNTSVRTLRNVNSIIKWIW